MSGHQDVIMYFVKDFYCNSIAKGLAPLHGASYYGELSIVKYLVTEEKTDRDPYGNTPLHYAALRDSMEVVKFLCKEYARYPWERNNFNMLSLHVALQYHSDATALFLIAVMYNLSAK